MNHRADSSSAAGDVSPRSARIALAFIVAAAFALRIVYVLQSRASPYFDAPQMDALYHVQWARAFAEHRDFQPGPFFRAPIYPWFLGLLFRAFGDGLLLPRVVQALIGSASCALVYAVARRAFDRRTGLLAALLAATYWMLIYFDGELLLPVLEVPTCLLALLACFAYGERPSARHALLAGLSIGLAALVRPNILAWAPFVVGWIALSRTSALRARLARALLCALAVFVPILPITAYNALAGHDLVLVSTQGGVNLWIGNNPTSDGSSAIAPGTRPDWWGGYHDTLRQAEAAEGRALKPSEVSSYYTHKALAWMQSDPLAALRLFAWKLRLFWIDFELGNNQSEDFFALRFGPILRWLPIGFGILAPLGLVGLALALRSTKRLWPLVTFVPVYCASVVLFFVCARFRMPLIAPLMVLAAHALVLAFDALRARAWRPLALGSACALVLFAVVKSIPARVDRTDAKGLWTLGVDAAQHNDHEEARALFEESIAANPRFSIARKDLGLSLIELGRLDEAEASLHAALALDPHNVGAEEGLVMIRLHQNRLDEALALAVQLAQSAPTVSRLPYLVGRVRMARAESSAARGAVQAARDDALAARSDFARAASLAESPDEAFNAHFAAGEALVRAGAPSDAVAEYDAALRARPEPDAEGWYQRCMDARGRAALQVGH